MRTSRENDKQQDLRIYMKGRRCVEPEISALT